MRRTSCAMRRTGARDDRTISPHTARADPDEDDEDDEDDDESSSAASSCGSAVAAAVAQETFTEQTELNVAATQAERPPTPLTPPDEVVDCFMFPRDEDDPDPDPHPGERGTLRALRAHMATRSVTFFPLPLPRAVAPHRVVRVAIVVDALLGAFRARQHVFLPGLGAQLRCGRAARAEGRISGKPR